MRGVVPLVPGYGPQPNRRHSLPALGQSERTQRVVVGNAVTLSPIKDGGRLWLTVDCARSLPTGSVLTDAGRRQPDPRAASPQSFRGGGEWFGLV